MNRERTKSIGFWVGIIVFAGIGLLLHTLFKYLSYRFDTELAYLIVVVPAFCAVFVISPVQNWYVSASSRLYCKKHGHEFAMPGGGSKYMHCSRCFAFGSLGTQGAPAAPVVPAAPTPGKAGPGWGHAIAQNLNRNVRLESGDRGYFVFVGDQIPHVADTLESAQSLAHGYRDSGQVLKIERHLPPLPTVAFSFQPETGTWPEQAA